MTLRDGFRKGGIWLVESNYFQGHLDINGAATVGVVGGDDSGWTDAVVVEESPEGELEEGVFALRVAGVQPAALLRRVFAGVVVAPPDHFLLSILVLFLCYPFGAVAVIKSLEAQAARQRGHAQSALVNAALAKRWALLGLTLGLVFNFFGLLMIMTYLCQTESEDDVPVYQ